MTAPHQMAIELVAKKFGGCSDEEIADFLWSEDRKAREVLRDEEKIERWHDEVQYELHRIALGSMGVAM